MEKIEYYQIAIKGEFPNQEYMKLVSPKRDKVNELINLGYSVFGFDIELDMPKNPILDNGEVREKTNDEIQQEIDYKKSLINVFNMRDIQDACDEIDTVNENSVLNDKLDGLTKRHLRHLNGASGLVDLNDNITQEAMVAFTEDEISNIKAKILEV